MRNKKVSGWLVNPRFQNVRILLTMTVAVRFVLWDDWETLRLKAFFIYLNTGKSCIITHGLPTSKTQNDSFRIKLIICMLIFIFFSFFFYRQSRFIIIFEKKNFKKIKIKKCIITPFRWKSSEKYGKVQKR